MKKVFFMMSLALMAFAVTSCSHEEVNDIQTANIEEAKVIIDLKNVNAELLANAPSETRGWSSWTTKEKAKVVSADVAGAVAGGKAGAWTGAKVGTFLGSPITGGVFGATIGAIVGGAWSSWINSPNEACEMAPIGDENTNLDDFDIISQSCRLLINDDLSINEEFVNSSVEPINYESKAIRKKMKVGGNGIDVNQDLIEQSKLDENSLVVGRMHNAMLSVLDGSIDIQSSTEIEGESELKRALFNSEELMNSCRNIKTDDSNLTSDKMLNKVMELFNQVLLEYPSKADDVAFIIGKYIDVIEQTTELTKDQKTHIKYGLSTALYSSIYWEQEFKNK